MSIYNVYMVDLVPDRARRLVRFGESQMLSVSRELAALFRDVCAGTTYQPQVNFLPGTPHPGELVVYFVLDRRHGIISREGGLAPVTHIGGQTSWLPGKGMLSEVYVAEAGPTTSRTANIAFHELMHNKLDLHPQLRLIADLHSDGGGGLARARVSHQETLSQRNIELMQRALPLSILQYWNPDLAFNPRHQWRIR